MKRLLKYLMSLARIARRPRGNVWPSGPSLPALRLDARITQFIEGFDEPVWTTLLAEVRPGDVVVDIGANIGVYSLMLGLKLGEKTRVIAFEPEPKNFALLQSNVRLNDLSDRVRCINAAVGASEGEIAISSNGPLSHVGGVGKKVPMVTLDRSLAGMKIDVLKIDVEGFEEMVLQGARGILRDPARAPRVIYLELHHSFYKSIGVATTPESLDRLFADLPYRRFLPSREEVRSFDGVWCCFAVRDEAAARKTA